MATMKRGEKTNAVREFVATNPTASPKEIVAALAEKGMAVKLGLANSVKYSKRGKTAARRRGRSVTMPSAARTSSGALPKTLTVEQLIEVKKLADLLGSLSQLRGAIDTLELLVARLP